MSVSIQYKVNIPNTLASVIPTSFALKHNVNNNNEDNID